MTYTLTDVVETYESIMEMREIKGAKYEFATLVYEIRKFFKPIFIDAEYRVEIIQKEISDLKLEFCKKDNENKPILIALADGKFKYDGLTKGLNPEYDNRIKELVDKVNELNKEEVPEDQLDFSEIIKINKDKCPKAVMKIKYWEALQNFIE